MTVRTINRSVWNPSLGGLRVAGLAPPLLLMTTLSGGQSAEKGGGKRGVATFLTVPHGSYRASLAGGLAWLTPAPAAGPCVSPSPLRRTARRRPRCAVPPPVPSRPRPRSATGRHSAGRFRATKVPTPLVCGFLVEKKLQIGGHLTHFDIIVRAAPVQGAAPSGDGPAAADTAVP